MGKRNRERRQAKRRQAGSPREPARRAVRAGSDATARGARSERTRPDFRSVLVSYARLYARGAAPEMRSALEVDLLDASAGLGRTRASLVYHEVLAGCLSAMWEGGWQPSEAVLIVKRKLTVRHSEVLLAAMAAFEWPDAPMPPGWEAQLTALNMSGGSSSPNRGWLEYHAARTQLGWGQALREAAQLLGVLSSLHRLEALLPTPSQWAGIGEFRSAYARADDPILAKVRALLAKAESTTFEEEAAALTAKAQELIARHAIDDAFAQKSGAQQRENPSVRRIWVEDPYTVAKGQLLAAVGATNRVRVIWDDAYGYMNVVGFVSDLDVVELLFTSLLVQASHALLAKGKIIDERGRSRTRSFRQSFYLAFASRIYERLSVANSDVVSRASGELGCEVLPVLASRQEEVDAATERFFPSLRPLVGPRATNAEGWTAGRVAAELAALGQRREALTEPS